MAVFKGMAIFWAPVFLQLAHLSAGSFGAGGAGSAGGSEVGKYSCSRKDWRIVGSSGVVVALVAVGTATVAFATDSGFVQQLPILRLRIK
jgi:hypothetical protein